jgi:hypothetical protein
MKKILYILVLLTLLLLVSVPVLAQDPPGECVHSGFEAARLSSSETGALGDAISDGFFGNEPNLINTNTNDDLGPEEVAPGSSAGNVVPSLSPGPQINGGGFLTLGTVIQAGCVNP